MTLLNCVTTDKITKIKLLPVIISLISRKKHGVGCKFNIFMAELHSEFCYLVQQRQIRQIAGAEK